MTLTYFQTIFLSKALWISPLKWLQGIYAKYAKEKSYFSHTVSALTVLCQGRNSQAYKLCIFKLYRTFFFLSNTTGIFLSLSFQLRLEMTRNKTILLCVIIISCVLGFKGTWVGAPGDSVMRLILSFVSGYHFMVLR